MSNGWKYALPMKPLSNIETERRQGSNLVIDPARVTQPPRSTAVARLNLGPHRYIPMRISAPALAQRLPMAPATRRDDPHASIDPSIARERGECSLTEKLTAKDLRELALYAPDADVSGEREPDGLVTTIWNEGTSIEVRVRLRYDHDEGRWRNIDYHPDDCHGDELEERKFL